jgi:16S rRNA (cytidine1402-2'-O)-methyltransferase
MNSTAIDSSKKLEGKLLAGLYIVATPIGNLSDITLRALDVLQRVDLIACEDTRVSGKLLAHYKITTKKLCYNDFSNDKERSKIIELLKEGKNIALISDAGTPLISDPGYKLIKAVRAANIQVTPITGASAVTTAISASDIASHRFTFLGFLPPKQNARQQALTEFKDIGTSLILFESPNRIERLIEDIQIVMGNRKINICRELTKMHEEIISGQVADLSGTITKKGEFVVIIEASEKPEATEDETDLILREGAKYMSVKDLVEFTCKITGKKKNLIYKKALAKQKDHND